MDLSEGYHPLVVKVPDADTAIPARNKFVQIQTIVIEYALR